MRKWIVRFFALDYIVNIFDKPVRFTRSANFIFPSLILTMGLEAYSFQYWWVALILFFFFAFFGFFYFRFKPLTNEDIKYFDEPQLYCWWVANNYKYKYDLKKFNSLWVVLLNPLMAVVLSFLLYLRFS